MATLEQLQPFVGPKVDVALTPADADRGWQPRVGAETCALSNIDLLTNFGRPSGKDDPRLHIAPFPDDFSTRYASPGLTYLFTVTDAAQHAEARVKLDPDPETKGEFQIQDAG